MITITSRSYTLFDVCEIGYIFKPISLKKRCKSAPLIISQTFKFVHCETNTVFYVEVDQEGITQNISVKAKVDGVETKPELLETMKVLKRRTLAGRV